MKTIHFPSFFVTFSLYGSFMRLTFFLTLSPFTIYQYLDIVIKCVDSWCSQVQNDMTFNEPRKCWLYSISQIVGSVITLKISETITENHNNRLCARRSCVDCAYICMWVVSNCVRKYGKYFKMIQHMRKLSHLVNQRWFCL